MFLIVLGLRLAAAQAPAPDSLHLPEALRFARDQRGTLVAAGASTASARAAARQLRALPNPTGTYTYNQSPPGHLISVQQSFDWLLRRGPNAQAGSAAVLRAAEDSLLAVADLEAEVRRAWYGALSVDRGRAVAETQLAIADSMARIAARRLEAGDISATEHDRLRLERVLALQTLSRARAADAGAVLRLRRTLGWPDSVPWPALAGSLTDGLDDDYPAPAALENLPEVRWASADSVGASASLRSARAARVPLPSLEVGRQYGDPSFPGKGLWLVGVSLPLPLFDRGGAASAAQAAHLQQAAAALTEARLVARQRVAEAAVQLEESAIRARLARDSLLPGSNILRARAARAYELGETGVLPLLDALRTEREINAGALGDLLAFQEARAAWLALKGHAE